MLIDLGVTCAWIAMSAASAAGLALFGRPGVAELAGAAAAQAQPEPEDLYSLEPPLAIVQGSWL